MINIIDYRLCRNCPKCIMTKYLICLIFIVSAFNVSSKERFFKRIDNSDGLSSNIIRSFVQDSRGFLWIGTDNGVLRYDGREFNPILLSSIDSTYSIQNNIYNLYQDSENNIWMCCEGELKIYNYKKDTIERILLDNEQTINGVTDITEKTGSEIWFINNKYTYQYNLMSGKCRLYKYVYAKNIITAPNGSVFITDDSGYISRFNPKFDNFERCGLMVNYNSEDKVESVKIITKNNREVLIATKDNGVFLFDTYSYSTKCVFSDKGITNIAINSENECWICSENGINVYDINSYKFIDKITSNKDNPYSICNNNVTTIYNGRSEITWIGTTRGISYLDNNYKSFNYINGQTNSNINFKGVRSITTDKRGDIFIATEDNGVAKLNDDFSHASNQLVTSKQTIITKENCTSVMALDNVLWVGTKDNGIATFDISTGNFICQYTESDRNIHSNSITTIINSSLNEVYVGTRQGVQKLNTTKNSFEFIDKLNHNLKVNGINIDSAKNIWISFNSQLLLYRPKGDSVSNYIDNSDHRISTSNRIITGSCEDHKGNIWVATLSDGIIILDGNKNIVSKINNSSGFYTNNIYSIFRGDSGDMWATTSKGLILFHGSYDNYTRFDSSNGLQDVSFVSNANHIRNDGLVFLGTSNGVVTLNTIPFRNNFTIPHVYITDFKLVKPNKNIIDNRNNFKEQTQNIILPHKNSSFTISFSAISPSQNNNYKYKCMLEGADKEWADIKDQRNVSYLNLPPGTYKFKVKTYDGIVESTERLLKITILPPFWATVWAYILYSITLLLIMGFIIIVMVRRKSKRLREALLNVERNKEIELFNAKIEFFTHVVHEIKTPLTLIKLPLDYIIESGGYNDDISSKLAIIKRQTVNLIELTKQLLDFRKIGNSNVQLNFMEEDISVIIKGILENYNFIIKEYNKKITVNISETPFIASIDIITFNKIIYNMMSNAVKYSNNYISISLRKTSDDKYFEFIMSNDGEIIPLNSRKDIFEPFSRFGNKSTYESSTGVGLTLSASLAKLHGGELCMDRDKSVNRFILKLPLQQQNTIDIDDDKVKDKTETHYLDCKNESVIIPKITGHTILVVEDNNELREVMSVELSKYYNIISVENGRKALEVLGKSVIRLVITDISMPIINGLTLCSIVKGSEKFLHIPVIILTAKTDEKTHIETLSYGADSYIEKPFSMALLTAQIDNLLFNRNKMIETNLKSPTSLLLCNSYTKSDELFFMKINKLIEDNMSDTNLNVEMLAKMASVSTSYLYRKIKRATSMSPNEYLKNIRLTRSVTLLLGRELRINEIAFRTGFSTPSYFTNCFKAKYNMTPKEFVENADKMGE